ncbi:MAG: DUF6259 domain-containing protein [Candidatus Latescibacter sp.]|nr:DUF6259 domain-containing protein [Candidatus Latescibacter sp.]
MYPGKNLLFRFPAIFACLSLCFPVMATAQPGQSLPGCWPQEYTVQRDDTAGTLTLSTPFYTIQHNLKKGGALSSIKYAYGHAASLILQPVETSVQTSGGSYSDLSNSGPVVNQVKKGNYVTVTVDCPLLDRNSKEGGIRVKTRYEYRWGYVKIHKEIIFPDTAMKTSRVTVLSTVFDPGLSQYGIRQDITYQEGTSPTTFGVCEWRKARAGTHFDPPLMTRFVPRYLVLANQGIEGIEWFVSDDLSQWDYQLSGEPGNGYCNVRTLTHPLGVSVSISPLYIPGSVTLKGLYTFDYYIGFSILEGHANKPWLHTSFNRSKGAWVSEENVKKWADSGIRTAHCHNDGDAYGDGLFWRDGSYPPYPPEDMKKYDEVIANCHKYGIKAATYFSNKELHPSTDAFKEHGEEWGRKPDDSGKLIHNRYGKDEFGAQMCLKSGWLEYLEFCIDRVLKNHKLDGVYFDWNVALYCNNPLHMGKTSNGISPDRGLGTLALSPTGHWDMDGLVSLMEWTRERVGPTGMIIVHDTMTPMFVTENFANYVVGMEWGYGWLSKAVPPVDDLPLEWNFAGARSRGVIGYGTIDSNAPKRLHRLLALETLLTGVAPWPASPEAKELYTILRPLGDIEKYRFEDYRNTSVTLDGANCASALYSRPGEAYILLGNFNPEPRTVACKIEPKALPYALPGVQSVEMTGVPAPVKLDIGKLAGNGESFTIPADSAVMIHIR